MQYPKSRVAAVNCCATAPSRSDRAKTNSRTDTKTRRGGAADAGGRDCSAQQPHLQQQLYSATFGDKSDCSSSLQARLCGEYAQHKHGLVVMRATEFIDEQQSAASKTPAQQRLLALKQQTKATQRQVKQEQARQAMQKALQKMNDARTA